MGYRSGEIANTNYTGFIRRFGACVIDGFAFSLIAIVVIIVLILFMNTLAMDIGSGPGKLIIDIVSIAIGPLYYAYFESSEQQATPGKRASGIIVADYKGKRISFLRALGRYFARILSIITLMLGYIMALFTPKKQALHDLICKTVVVNRAKSRFWRFFFLTIIAYIAMCVGIAMFGMKLLMPLMMDQEGFRLPAEFSQLNQGDQKFGQPGFGQPKFGQNESANEIRMQESASQPQVQQAPAAIVDPQSAIVNNFTKENYLKIFDNYKTPASDADSVEAGPFLVKKANGSMNNEVALDIHSKQLMRFDLEKRISVRVAYVLSNDGYNIYDATYFKERSDFAKMVDESWAGQIPDTLSFKRDIHLLEKYNDVNVAGIAGSIKIVLPEQAAFYNLDPNIPNQSIINGDREVRFVKLTGTMAEFEITGYDLSSINFNTVVENKEYYGKISSWSGGNKIFNINVTFDVAPQMIGVHIDQKSMEFEYPFVVGKKYEKKAAQ